MRERWQFCPGGRLPGPWRAKREESRFSFEWGVLLQLGDDLQDVREDIRRGSVTLFSRAAMQGRPLDGLVIQLLNFSEQVGDRMDDLSNGTEMLKKLLRMSWRSLIVGAVANSHEYFSPGFLDKPNAGLRFVSNFSARGTRDYPAAKVYMRFFSRPSLSHAKPMMANSQCQTIARFPTLTLM